MVKQFRGVIRGFLKSMDRNSIRLSMIQKDFERIYNGSRWWSVNIPNELRKLNCTLYADGYGDFIVDISHLRPGEQNIKSRRDMSFRLI